MALAVQQPLMQAFAGFSQAPTTIMGPRDNGVVISSIDTTLQGLGFTARRERSRPGRYDEVFDWMDVLEKYADQYLELPSQLLTAVLLNQRGNVLIATCAPPFLTYQNNFVITASEALMIPFDEMATGGIPRTTTLVRDVKSFSMSEFKRAQMVTMQAFEDPIYGAKYMDEITGVLAQQAQLTVIKNISTQIAFTPFEVKMRQYAQADRLHCGKEIFAQIMSFAAANKSPEDLVRAILNMHQSTVRPIDLVVLPEGMGAMLGKTSQETRSIPAYSLVYNEQTRQFIERVFDGPRSIATFRSGNGTPIDVIENPNLRTLAQSPEKDTFQSLRSFPLLGEVILMPETDRDNEPKGDPAALDVWVHNQGQTSLKVDRIRFVDGLKAAGIWNDVFRDGGHENYNGKDFLHKTTPGDLLREIFTEYNSGKKQKEVRDYLRDTSRDANSPHLKDVENRTLRAMTNFRNVHPFAAVLADGSIGMSPSIGGMSERMVPNEALLRVSRGIIHLGCAKLGLNKNFLESAANIGGASAADDLAARDTFVRDVAQLLKEYLPASAILAVSNDEFKRWLFAVEGKHHSGATTGLPPPEFVYNGPITLAVAATHKSLDEYVAAFPLQTLTQLNQLNGASKWVQGLAAVPSTEASLKHYLSVIYAAQQQLASVASSSTNDPTAAAVDKVLEAFKAHAGRTTAAVALQTAAEHIKSKGTFAALAAKPLVSNNAAFDARDISSDAELKFAALAGRRAAAGDAMDIEEHTPAKQGWMDRFLAQTASLSAMWLPDAVAGTIGGNGRLEFIRELDALTAIVMTALCLSKNCPRTHIELANRVGASLFRLNYWRPFQRYRMLSVSGLVGGGATFKTAINHAFSNLAASGVEGYLMIIATFRMRVLPQNPQFTDILLNVICDGFFGGCDVRFCTSQDEASADLVVKPSIIPVVVPYEETHYYFPQHMLNWDVYTQSERNDGNVPLFKHSGADQLKAFFSETFLTTQQAVTDEAYLGSRPAVASLVAHCSHRWYRGDGDRLISQPGTGPRGEARVNVPSAAQVWSGGNMKFALTADEVSFAK